ncbi:hypothetical protein AMTRI_Chr12g239810 [Amborella trichopoda]
MAAFSIAGRGLLHSGLWKSRERKGRGIRMVSARSGSLMEEYRTLRIKPGASEMDVKKAFRQLALQYHPDVCKGNNCGVQFHKINEAYDIVMRSLRESEGKEENGYESSDEMRGMYDSSSWDLWEDWMGWEGAGIRDYTSHINPYI